MTRKTRKVLFKKSKFPFLNSGLKKQITFLSELEKLKTIYRQNGIIGGSRPENSAEHSWHLAVMATVLADLPEFKGVNLLRVVKMLLIHDIVEIDAGDTFLYSKKGNKTKASREAAAAERIFGLLPSGQKRVFVGLWKEFEERKTREARFAAALDGFQPILNRYLARGKWPKKGKLKKSQVLEKKKYIGDISPALWKCSRNLIDLSTQVGIYSNL